MEIGEIRKNLMSIFSKNFIKTAIWYGNKEGQDIDIFIIFKKKISYNCFQYQGLDISYIGEDEIEKMLSNFDPLITEPILTGQEIYGRYLSVLKKELSSIKANNDAVEYLINRAQEFYDWSQKHLVRDNHKQTIIALSFVISFIHFANYYKHHKQVITFKNLMEDIPNDLLLKTMALIKNTSRIKKDVLVKLSQETKEFIDKH
jgi:hypothetical protein